GGGDLVPRLQLLRARGALRRMFFCRAHRQRRSVEEEVVEVAASDVHDDRFRFHFSCNSFLVEKRIHFEFPSLMPRISPISAWLSPSISKRLKTERRCSGSSSSSFRSVMRF